MFFFFFCYLLKMFQLKKLKELHSRDGSGISRCKIGNTADSATGFSKNAKILLLPKKAFQQLKGSYIYKSNSYKFISF